MLCALCQTLTATDKFCNQLNKVPPESNRVGGKGEGKEGGRRGEGGGDGRVEKTV